jgi:hypothetical protein
MAATTRKTDEVLSSARKELEAQLAIVRDEIARLTAEEHALTHAVSSLDGGNPAMSTGGKVSKSAGSRTAKSQATTRSTPKAVPGHRRRPRGATKSTADRVNELRGLLADGPKSRSDLAAALKVSPARVQQLLAELGSSVSSQPDPQRRGKLWGLKGSGNGASAAKPAAGEAKRPSARKPAARKGTATK